MVKSFSRDLEVLLADVGRMGGLAERAVAAAIEATARGDAALAREVVAADQQIDAAQHAIEQSALRLLALRQPLAVDLRQVVACLKVVTDLERIGDLSKSIARRSLVVDAVVAGSALRSLERMGARVMTQLHGAMDAFVGQDTELALRIWRADDDIDTHYASLFREFLNQMIADTSTITVGAHLLFMAKNLERVGDHATNIVEAAHYFVTGENIPGERPKGESTARHVDTLMVPTGAAPTGPVRRNPSE
jgi:phosphate transport system protein